VATCKPPLVNVLLVNVWTPSVKLKKMGVIFEPPPGRVMLAASGAASVKYPVTKSLAA
jgi:hypothetical protein